MPPKGPQAKQAQKVIEDKTFGLKNKKGKKQQTFIKQVETSAAAKAAAAQRLREQGSLSKTAEDIKREKEQKRKEQEELAKLFKPVQEKQKMQEGVDPKSVLCAFFKQGLCTKGSKCKYSHDLAIERKAEKRSIYTAEEDEKKNETMETWDQAQLEDAINKKFGAQNKNRPTEIICKFFLDAVEKSLYGWFWECPGGPTCKYRHALPPGFVLKRDQKKADSDEPSITLEELVESERSKLGPNLTPVTLETFLAWKAKKKKEAEETAAAAKKKNMEKAKQGFNVGISGRDLFEFNPELFVDDESAMDDTAYVREERPPSDDEDDGATKGALDDGPVDEALFEEMDDLEIDDDEVA
eukprot:comp17361_c0_seq1/m.16648 comp17361_c0_seq1/g.16648  ORF comp17361_c0_seq1/g.16648 comp17361_c0_seq1/m.16648 type:complete len:354 (-) comp17361_c0_seq1:12-1073(-)